MDNAVIEIRDAWKSYHIEEVEIPAVRGVSLSIPAGQFVAVTGASGSGKSTFLHLVGCLDRLDDGEYSFEGRPVERLSRWQLAVLRNRRIGFVFQNFNLLPRTTILDNVALPLSYQGVGRRERRRRAGEMLARVGLTDRLKHHPNQLSGGQQQRVAVARALVTRPAVLLADEPTGNLDSTTSHELMNLLKTINREQNVSIVLVTHETDIAAFAERQVNFRDGRIVRDVCESGTAAISARPAPVELLPRRQETVRPTTVIAESLRSLTKNKIRTALSILGIVIGIGAVIAMVAVATGAQRKVEREIAAIGDDWLAIWYMGTDRAGVHRDQATPPNLTKEDAEAIERECTAVRAASPTNRVQAQVISQYGNYRTGVMGVYPNFFDIRRWQCSSGRLFSNEDMAMHAKVCCIGVTAAKELFGPVNPIGETIRVNRVAFDVVGLLESKGVGTDGRDFDDIILFPFSSFQRLIAGNEPSGTLFAAAKHGVPLSMAKDQIRDLLRQRRRLGDNDEDTFRIMDRSLMAQASAEATNTFNLLLTSIASISLVVGGVGIMNIMLVSVTERTREIGLRMAIGANSLHVLSQFLCEAIVLCVIGGLIGFAAGWGVSQVVSARLGWETEVSYWMAGVAILFAMAVGVFFGFYPAWRASRLNPIDALRYE